jgi:hypothetical protein
LWPHQGRMSCLLCACHTRFSKEQNQANHMCAQEVHTYVRMKKYQNNVYIKQNTYYINIYNYQSIAERSLIFSSGSNITGTADWWLRMLSTSYRLLETPLHIYSSSKQHLTTHWSVVEIARVSPCRTQQI